MFRMKNVIYLTAMLFWGTRIVCLANDAIDTEHALSILKDANPFDSPSFMNGFSLLYGITFENMLNEKEDKFLDEPDIHSSQYRIFFKDGSWRINTDELRLKANDTGNFADKNKSVEIFDAGRSVMFFRFYNSYGYEIGSPQAIIATDNNLCNSFNYVMFLGSQENMTLYEFLESKRDNIKSAYYEGAFFTVEIEQPKDVSNFKFVFDRTKGYGLVGYRGASDSGNIHSKLKVNLDELAPGLWLPVSGILEVFKWEEDIVRYRVVLNSINSSDFSNGIPDDIFEFEFPLGTRVIDKVAGIKYRTDIATPERLKNIFRAQENIFTLAEAKVTSKADGNRADANDVQIHNKPTTNINAGQIINPNEAFTKKQTTQRSNKMQLMILGLFCFLLIIYFILNCRKKMRI